MYVDEPALLRDLSELRKGAGVWTADLRTRIGGQLAPLCGITAQDDNAAIREKLQLTVVDLLNGAAQPLQQAVLAAFGMVRGSQLPTVTARREWLAVTMPCDVRTVRRLEDRGFARIVATAVSRDGIVRRDTGGTAYDWYLRSVRALVRLDTATPEVLEERTIVANRDGLDQIVASVSLPRPDRPLDGPGVHASVLYGAELEDIHSAPQHYRFTLRLPRRMRLGEEHAYGIAYRLAPGQPTRPHWVLQPLLPCNAFDLRLRFDTAHLPEAVWLLDAVPPRVVDDGDPTEDRLQPDDVGDVRVSFNVLSPGLGYGLAWRLPKVPVAGQMSC
jgi:hypothetical protein